MKKLLYYHTLQIYEQFVMINIKSIWYWSEVSEINTHIKVYTNAADVVVQILYVKILFKSQSLDYEESVFFFLSAEEQL